VDVLKTYTILLLILMIVKHSYIKIYQNGLKKRGLIGPPSYSILVYRPNRIESSTITVNTVGVTKLLPKDFTDPDEWDIPDGIWKFQVENCGKTYYKYRAVTCKLQCKIDSMLAIAQNDIQRLAVYTHQATLDQIHRAVEIENIKVAEVLLEKLNNTLSCINC
jgi:hypothetical protein